MTNEYSFEHHGVKGQKWGVRRTPEQLGYSKSDSPMTKRVKKDYNSMDNREFKGKYGVSKEKYAKRVEKYGDPYMNSPYSKRLQRKRSKDLEKAEYKKYQEAYYNREKYSTKQLNEMNNRMNAEMNFRRNLNNAKPKNAGAELGKEWGRRFATAIALLAVSEGSRYIYSKGKEGGFALIRDLAQSDEGCTGVNELYSFEHHGVKGQKVWNKQLENELTKSLLHFASQNKNYQKAYDLNKKYGLDKSDSSLKSQTDALNDAMKNSKG